MIFTQFLLPNGRKKQIEIIRSEEIENKAKKITDKGFNFEIELLRNGMVHMDCCNIQEAISSHLCKNDEQIPETVDKIVNKAFDVLFGKQ